MHKLKEILAFLRSIWGLLASAFTLFPLAASFLRLDLAVENSRLAALYTFVPAIGGAMALLLLTSFHDVLSDLARARKTSLAASALGFTFFFAYLEVRVLLLDVDQTELISLNDVPASEAARSRGVVSEQGISRVDAEINLPGSQESHSIERRHEREAGDPWDVLALALVTAFVMAFTVGFGALGIHSYLQTEARRQSLGPPNSKGVVLK